MTAKPKNGKQLIARSDALDRKLEKHPDIANDIKELFRLGKRNRRLINLLYVSIILEVVLGVTVAYFIAQSYISNNRIERNHTVLVANCNSGNEFRKDNLTLWSYILNIPPQKPLTQQEQKIAADFSVFVKNTFALRDCNKIK